MSFGRKVYERPPRQPLKLGSGESRAVMGGGLREPAPKEPPKTRSEDYRRLVAGLPCAICGLEGYAQAAHPNSNKAKGSKADDLLCFPLCSVAGNDCHASFDQFRYCRADAMPEHEARWTSWTQAALKSQADSDRATRRVLASLGMLL